MADGGWLVPAAPSRAQHDGSCCLRGEPEEGRGRRCKEGPAWVLEEFSVTHCLLCGAALGQPRVGGQIKLRAGGLLEQRGQWSVRRQAIPLRPEVGGFRPGLRFWGLAGYVHIVPDP